ncbi:MAG: hypothetical protein ACK4GT_04730 [Pararhodobacter sp.]
MAEPAVVAAFGHGVPLGDPVLAGLCVRDMTLRRYQEPPGSRVAPMLEPFLDPFVRSFLLRLEAGAFDGAETILIWRQGAGALHAFRYAQEFQRLKLLPDGPPLLLWNRAVSKGAAAEAFDRAQDERLAEALAGLSRGPVIDRTGPLFALEALQAEGRITGAEAFQRRLAARAQGIAVDATPGPSACGPRLALAGAPLGGEGLHRWLDAQGALVLDLQGPDAPAGNPGVLLKARQVETLIWQVDPNDDLHGWRKPGMQALCAHLRIRFTDLGFISSWPTLQDLPEALP